MYCPVWAVNESLPSVLPAIDVFGPVTSRPVGPPDTLVPPVMASAVAAMFIELSMSMPARVGFTTVTPLMVLWLAAAAPNWGSLLVAQTPIWLPVRVPPDTSTEPVVGRFHSRMPYTVPVTL